MDTERKLATTIPHDLWDPECCGCLYATIRGDQADILCNECGILLRTVPVAELEKTLAVLAETEEICSATCTHCGALNVFPGFSTMFAFICSECGEGDGVEDSVQ